MSFILEALRRAEAERERAALPGLHARPVPLPEGAAAQARGAGRLGWGVAGLSLAALLGVLGWQWLAKPAPPSGAGPVAASRLALAPASVPASAPAETASSPSAALPGAAAASPAAAVAPPREAAPRPQPPPVRRAEARPRPPAAAPASAPPAAPASAAVLQLAVASAPAPLVAASATAAAPRLPGVADLPPAVRATLPALAIGGLVYADTPARRFVVINGQIYHEGGEPAVGVVVEQIKPKGAVLRYQGYRYEVGY